MLGCLVALIGLSTNYRVFLALLGIALACYAGSFQLFLCFQVLLEYLDGLTVITRDFTSTLCLLQLLLFVQHFSLTTTGTGGGLGILNRL
jgi:hypothetical protein